MTEPDERRPFGRLLTAMVTSFAADGTLDADGAQQLAAHPDDRPQSPVAPTSSAAHPL